MIRLHKRGPDGSITHYHEVWVEPQNRRIIEHCGRLGEQGEAKPHRVWLLRSLEEQVEALLSPARDAGYVELGEADHVWLIVEYGPDGWGNADDLEKRHALEDRLNEILGWTGLGECDGISMGSTTLEAACRVVDFALARAVITDALEGSEYGDVSRIYLQA